ncbi:hypothetical protein V5N11_005835 [Cardamine amara subsp. amara]|uniref:RsmI HTH domain-containing protein n=1 Tax=Cardamine amara subsp. amara TaxID=228776 RepID=A0ABD1C2Z4_CARAN
MRQEHKSFMFLLISCHSFLKKPFLTLVNQAREITKLHEEFWRGSLGEAKQEFLILQPKGEITLLIEGKEETKAENPTESQLEEELRALISDGHSLSTAVKTVAERTSMRKKEVYSLALKKFGKQIQVEDEADE